MNWLSSITTPSFSKYSKIGTKRILKKIIHLSYTFALCCDQCWEAKNSISPIFKIKSSAIKHAFMKLLNKS